MVREGSSVHTIFLDPRVAGDIYNSFNLCSFVLVSLSKLVFTCSPKPLNGLSSYFQGKPNGTFFCSTLYVCVYVYVMLCVCMYLCEFLFKVIGCVSVCLFVSLIVCFLMPLRPINE